VFHIILFDILTQPDEPWDFKDLIILLISTSVSGIMSMGGKLLGYETLRSEIGENCLWYFAQLTFTYI